MIVFRHALNDNVKKSGVMASSYVGRLNSRAFIPVMKITAWFKRFSGVPLH